MLPKSTQINPLIAITFVVIAATPAGAADMAGKWYGKLDSEPVITIAKAGAAYSASLDYPDTVKLVQNGGMRRFKQSTHKELVSFEAAGNAIRFTIRNTISINGDTNYVREEYSLKLSDDGGQLTGTERRTWYNEGPNQPRTALTPIMLFSNDWDSRSTTSQP
jgi:hypothetical protein